MQEQCRLEASAISLGPSRPCGEFERPLPVRQCLPEVCAVDRSLGRLRQPLGRQRGIAALLMMVGDESGELTRSSPGLVGEPLRRMTVLQGTVAQEHGLVHHLPKHRVLEHVFA